MPRPPAFDYRNSILHCEKASLPKLAQKHGTPLYVYSATTIRNRYRVFDRSFELPHTICYSVKANSNLSLLKLLAKEGAGFDVVSGGELERVRKVPRRAPIVFSGVGKTATEMDAALRAGILLFNLESEGELDLLAERAARLRKKAAVALRVNPDVAAETHPYISTGLREHKFGVVFDEARALYSRAAQSKWLEVAGVSVHIGSQITDLEPFAAAMERVAALVRHLEHDGHRIRYVDAGGGLGISYHGADDFSRRARAYAQAISRPLQKLRTSGAPPGRPLASARGGASAPPGVGLGGGVPHLILEPGRALVAPAGALLTRVLYLKSNGEKRFVVVDAAMNDLMRPSLYGAHHEIVAVDGRRSTVDGDFDVVGPVCETGDFFARDHQLPTPRPGDLLVILDTGAYGMSLASNYNSRPRPAEVLVEGNRARLIRRRESAADLYRQEA